MQVFANCYWNKTNIHVKAGERIHFHAMGQWNDFTILADADGFNKWHMKPFEKWRRVPESPWLSLIGAIDQKHYFFVGKENTINMPASGRLFLFANDIRFFYWNNNGQLKVKINRLQ